VCRRDAADWLLGHRALRAVVIVTAIVDDLARGIRIV
jgi:hypothetical protein